MATVFITGANRGLGLEFTRQYVQDGWEVVATCRTPDKADKLQALARDNKKVSIYALSVDKHDEIKALALKLRDKAIDVLINNAGIFSGGSYSGDATKVDPGQEFGTINPKDWETVLKINTISPILTIEAFLPNLEMGSAKKIINITSSMGSITNIKSGYIAYRSSKAALNAAMRTIASDLKSKQLMIVNLHPGWVKTDMGGAAAALTPQISVSNMRSVIAKLTLADSGKFFGYDGKIIPW